jgi:hypothetical protein
MADEHKRLRIIEKKDDSDWRENPVRLKSMVERRTPLPPMSHPGERPHGGRDARPSPSASF